MTSDKSLFKEFDGSVYIKVRIDIGDYIAVKGREIVVIEGYTSAKLITGVLYVPEIDQNLLSVSQLVEKGVKAANTTVFLLNGLPTKALEKKTPYEAWHDVKLSVKNLKVFGYVCYTHVPQEKRRKLDQKYEPGVFVGYSLQFKAYRVSQPQAKNVIVSRDVTFLEEEKWSWKEGNKGEKITSQRYWPLQLLREEVVEIDDTVDDYPVRDTGPLVEIYQRCNVTVLEPSCFEDAEIDQKWMATMKEELGMIEKNQTLELVDRPQDKNVI
ncbi:hypothetical protein CRG98_015810 [Punica granatum]|uniref:Uncharacterized protein n=1 Tax=Punica granatum TaxID=22663 RepID=A0A2I0K806_PUNGR|nr:hypothetical protein CRG98_015810 [Punica granatum]